MITNDYKFYRHVYDFVLILIILFKTAFFMLEFAFLGLSLLKINTI